MFDQGQRFQIARRFTFDKASEALRFVGHLAELEAELGGDYEIDLSGNTSTVRIAAAPLQAESCATLVPARMLVLRLAVEPVEWSDLGQRSGASIGREEAASRRPASL